MKRAAKALGISDEDIATIDLRSRKELQATYAVEEGKGTVEYVVGRLEREMEGVVVDMFDSPGLSESSSDPAFFPKPADAEDGAVSASENAAEKPVVLLSDIQRKIIASLNSLPGLKKELAFIHPVRNAHAVIISRDVKRFPGHKQGEGVIRHWADHLIM